MFRGYDDGWRIDGIIFGEVLFATPMMIAYGLSRLRTSEGARQVLLGYEIGYSLLTLIVFWTSFAGEHDAQYQLTLFLIPLIGFPSAAIAGLVAARLR